MAAWGSIMSSKSLLYHHVWISCSKYIHQHALNLHASRKFFKCKGISTVRHMFFCRHLTASLSATALLFIWDDSGQLCEFHTSLSQTQTKADLWEQSGRTDVAHWVSLKDSNLACTMHSQTVWEKGHAEYFPIPLWGLCVVLPRKKVMQHHMVV